MKVYIQTDKNGIAVNHNVFQAYVGFKEMGFETIMFNKYEELLDSNIEYVVVSGIGVIERRLAEFGKSIDSNDYPEELTKYLGRKVWTSTIDTISYETNSWPVFIKSKENKRITGKVISKTSDLIGCRDWTSDKEVYCSQVLDIIAEWSCYIRYGKVMGVKMYKGDWRANYDSNIIEQAVKDFTSQPKAYAMDFGLTSDGKMVLIEINNTCSIGNYGLFALDYAKFISARWAELTGTEDECDF